MRLDEFCVMLDGADNKFEAVAVFADWLETSNVGPWNELRQLTRAPNVLWIQMLQTNLSKECWRAIGWEILGRASRIAGQDYPQIDVANRRIGRSSESISNSTWKQRLVNDMIVSVGQCDDAETCSRLFDQLLMLAQQVGDATLLRERAAWISGLLGWQLSVTWIEKQAA